MKKCVIIMAGGNAAGKTTTTKAFTAESSYTEYKDTRDVPTRKGIRPMKITWTLFPDIGVGVSGNWNNGTDANVGPGSVREAFNECMKVSDIVIVDGAISSPQWLTMIIEWLGLYPDCEVKLVLVHFDLSAEVLLARFATRMGVDDKECIRDDKWVKCVELVARVQNFVQNNVYGIWGEPDVHLVVSEENTTEDIVAALKDAVTEVMI